MLLDPQDPARRHGSEDMTRPRDLFHHWDDRFGHLQVAWLIGNRHVPAVRLHLETGIVSAVVFGEGHAAAAGQQQVLQGNARRRRFVKLGKLRHRAECRRHVLHVGVLHVDQEVVAARLLPVDVVERPHPLAAVFFQFVDVFLGFRAIQAEPVGHRFNAGLHVGDHAQAQDVGNALEQHMPRQPVIHERAGERHFGEYTGDERLVVFPFQHHAFVQSAWIDARHLQFAGGDAGNGRPLQQLLPADAGTPQLSRQALGESLAAAVAASRYADKLHGSTR